MVKNCDLGRENAALGLQPRSAFSSPRSQFFTIRTSQPANNIYLLYIRLTMKNLIGREHSINKQLLDEVEHDIMNYQNRGLGYLPKPKAEADNTDTRF